MSDGWIKLHRQIRKHWIWKDNDKLKAWLDILLEVNYEDKKVLLGSKLVTCERGQSLHSIRTWGKRWKWSKDRVVRFLNLLKYDGMIELKPLHNTTQLTVCNYELYQQTQDTNEHTSETLTSTPARHEQATNKKEKKDKNERSKDNTICAEPETDSTPVVIELILNDKSLFPVHESKVNEWKELYPAVDIMQELRKMKGWLDANANRRKTKRGITAFINTWLSRTQDRSNGTTKQGTTDGYDKFAKFRDRASGSPEPTV